VSVLQRRRCAVDAAAALRLQIVCVNRLEMFISTEK
jgi:hypothetical protein